MKKKLTALALVVVMVAMLFTGLTMAYFTDNDTATNTFTVGDVEIEVNENGDPTDGLDYEDIVPGIEYDKEVTVENTGKNDAYVRVTVTIPGTADMSRLLIGLNHTDWTLAKSEVVNGEWVAVFNYNSTLAPEKATSALFTAFGLPANMSEEEFAALISANADGEFSVEIFAEAIQAEGFLTAQQAFAALAGEEVAVAEVTPATIQDAIMAAEPGDVIVLGDGQYDALVLANADGSPKSGISIIGKGGNGFVSCAVGSINLNSSSDITLKNICFECTEAETVYKYDGTDAGFVASIIGAQAGGITGAQNIVIDGCSFKTTSTPADNYVAIAFEEQGRPDVRAANITVKNCKLDKAAFNFARMNYMGQGNLVFMNNSIVAQGGIKHNTLNFTGNAANLIIKGNTFGLKSGFSNAVLGAGWGADAAAIGSSRQGDNFITIEVTDNTFINNALSGEGKVLGLKDSYTSANCSVEFAGNTYQGGLDGMTDATAPCAKP